MSRRIKILISFLIIILISVNITVSRPIDAVIPGNINNSDNSTENNEDQFNSGDSSDTTLSRKNSAPWIIDSLDSIINETKIINRSIIIESGGKLIIENSTVLVNSTNDPVIITVEKDGEFNILNSKFDPHNGQLGLGYTIRVYGGLLINNSILNNLCAKSGTFAVESCSGTSYQDTYTPGIEIYSDFVEITWSEFNLAWNSSIFISGSQPILNNNKFSNNTQSLMIVDSEVELIGNEFDYNLDAIQLDNCDFKLINSEFSQIGGYCLQSDKSTIVLENVSLEDVSGTLIIIESSIYIDNSSFYYCNDLYLIDSELFLNNTDLINFYGSFSCSNISGTISNCTYRDIVSLSIMNSYDIRIENSIFDSISGYGLFIMYSEDVMIINNSIMNTEVGMFFQSSNGTLSSNTLLNNSQGCVISGSNLRILSNNFFNNFQGLNIGYSYCEVINNSLNKNTDAIICIDAEGLIENNVITSNREGITYMYSGILVTNNLIANNSWWGINLTGSAPDLTGIVYSNATEKPNGYGRIIKMGNIRVHVLDSNGKSIQNADVRVTDKNHQEIYNKKAYSFSSASPLIVYMILNSDEKIEFNPYMIEASWRNEHFSLDIIPGPISNVTIVEIIDYSIIVIELPLPDLYINPSDIEVSDTNPKHDDTVDIYFTVHYSGEMPTSNTVNVSITANGAVITRTPISFDPSDKTKKQDFKIPWTVVSWEDGPVDIKVRIDEINNIENNLLDYDENNSAKITINVRGEKLEDSSWQDYSYGCLILIILLVIIFFITLFVLIRARKKKRATDEVLGKDTSALPIHGEKNVSLDRADEKIKDNEALKKEIKKEKYKKKQEKMNYKNRKSKAYEEKHNKNKSLETNGKNEKNKGMGKDKDKIDDDDDDNYNNYNKDKNNNKDKKRKKSIEQRIRDDYTRDGPRIKW